MGNQSMRAPMNRFGQEASTSRGLDKAPENAAGALMLRGSTE